MEEDAGRLSFRDRRNDAAAESVADILHSSFCRYGDID